MTLNSKQDVVILSPEDARKWVNDFLVEQQSEETKAVDK